MAGCARPESTFDPKGKPVNSAIFTSNAQNNFSSLSDNIIQLEKGKNAIAKQRRKVFCKTFIPNSTPRFTTNLDIL